MTMSRINKMALRVKPVLSLEILMLGAEKIVAHTSYRNCHHEEPRSTDVRADGNQENTGRPLVKCQGRQLPIGDVLHEACNGSEGVVRLRHEGCARDGCRARYLSLS